MAHSLFIFTAENIEYVITFIDPQKRILKDVKIRQFSKEDYEAINLYIGKRGAKVLSGSLDDHQNLIL